MIVSGYHVQVEIRLHGHLFGVSAEVEAELLQDALHGAVIEEYLCGDTTQTLGAGDLEEATQEQGADAPALEAVADEDRELRLFGDGAAAAKAGYAHDLTFPGLWIGVLGDQRHLAVVVYEADARQALVGRALVEVHHVEVAHVDALFREGLVEAHHQGLVFGTDRAYRHGRAVAQLFVKDVLLRVRTDRGSWEDFSFVSGSCRTIRASRAIRRSGEARSGLMSSSLIQGCSTTSWLVRTSSLSREPTSTGALPLTPPSASKIRVLSIIRLASVVVSGGRARARSLYTSTSEPPDPKSRTGPNCGSRLLPTISS